MKFLTFRLPHVDNGHFGVILADGKVLDLTALSDRNVPKSLIECIQKGEPALDAIRAIVAKAESEYKQGGQNANVYSLDQVALEVPLRPGKIMAVGKNYADHVAEGLSGKAYNRVAGFIKLSNGVVPHKAAIIKPTWTEKFDYENELAIVIGRECCDVPGEKAYDCVFGYTILNDLSCRDVQLAERKEGNICIGKNFPTSSPIGPWIVTKDEIPDPHNLRIVTRVNGEIRQDGTTANQIYRIPEQIAWYSRAGFEAGDVISSGTPAGTALGYKGDTGTWYLNSGDIVECEIEKIGVLVNTVA